MAERGAREETRAWLDRVHHDLVKRLLWPARDRRDAGGSVVPGELETVLVDEEGAPIEAVDLWRRLADDAPRLVDDATKEDFARAVARCRQAAALDDLEGVCELGAAFERLAHYVKGLAPS